MGMDSETLRRATEPFFTTKGVGKGTGLGLPMVHGFARQIGGAFTLESAAGEGTQARLWLPIAGPPPERAAAAAEEEEAPAPLPRLTVLVVDDDPLVLLNTAALLEDLGQNVISASNGGEALTHFAQNKIDIVITDQAMPGLTGTELASEIGLLDAQIPIIIASGYGEGMEIPAGPISRLSKPFRQSDLVAAIHTALPPQRGRRAGDVGKLGSDSTS